MPDAGKIFYGGGSVIAQETGQQTINSTITNTSIAFAQSTAEAIISEAWETVGEEAGSSYVQMALQGLIRLKNFGGMFSYLSSKWALATFTVVSTVSSEVWG